MTAWGARIYFRRFLRTTLVAAALLALLVAAAAWISSDFYDVSFDGQAYQQEGVYQLAHGWNPLLTPRIYPVTNDQNVKLISFTKGPWIMGAAMYRLTGRIETGKFANIVLIVAAFSLALAAVGGVEKKLRAWPLAMAALAAANPVSLCQIFTFYVDGQMAALLACLAALCFLSAASGNPWVDFLLFAAAVLLIQVKFTGLVYATLFFAGFIALLAWRKRPLRKPIFVALLALGLGTCVFGKNPYVFNTFENGSPFYPFFGRGDFPIITMTKATPVEFWHRNRAANLGASLFSRSRDWPVQFTLKAPWQVGSEEWAAFEDADVLVGGFGPLFAVALILSWALLALVLRRGGDAAWNSAAIFVLLFVSVLPVSACWWARYAPQVWLVPLVALASLGGANERPLLHRLSWLVLLILSVNVAGIEVVNFRANLTATRETAENIEDLRSHAPFKIAFGYFHSNRFRLREAGIPFIEDEGIHQCDLQVEEDDGLCISP